MLRSLTLPPPLRGTFPGLLVSVTAALALAAALAPVLDERHIVDVALLYLLLTLVSAALWGYAVGLFAAVFSDVLVNFLFVPPLHHFTVQEPVNVAALVIYLAVAVVGASMLSLLRRQATIAAAGEAEANILRSATQSLAREAAPQKAMERFCTVVAESLKARGCSLLQLSGGWRVRAATIDASSAAVPSREEEAMASEAVRTGQVIRRWKRDGGAGLARLGKGRETTDLTFVPLGELRDGPAVLRLLGNVQAPPLIEIDRLLRAFADEGRLALERFSLAGEAARAEGLRRADEFKSVLLSSVSHDLRSPLTAIKTAVGSLRDTSIDWADEDRESFLGTIEAQTDRLTTMVTELLEMSRLESGTVNVQLEAIAARPFLEDVARAARHVAGGRGIEVAAENGLWFRGDYALLMQSLGNLIENAARYSVAGSPIHLEASKLDHHVVVSVRDEGPGIAPEDLPHIFEKFYRGAQERRKTKGTGLGLAIVKAMTELSGGTVTARSNPEGTVFTLTLPAARPPAV